MNEKRTWEKSRRRKRLRLAAVALSFSLLAADYPDVWTTLSALAAETQEKEDGEESAKQRYLTGFVTLSEEILEQTVPLGTPMEELDLPESLEAYVSAEEREAGDEEPGDTDETEDADTEEPDNTDETEDADTEDSDDTDETEDADTEEAGGTDETEDADAEEAGDTDETEDADAEDSDGADETEDADAEEAGDTDDTEDVDVEDPDGDTSEEENPAGLHVETGSFTLPEYQSENLLTVETLEETVTIEDIAWQSDPAYDGETEGEYLFTPVLSEEDLRAAGYVLAEGVDLPQIVVTVQAEVQPAVRSRSAARAAAGGDLRSHTDHNGWSRCSGGTMLSGNYYLEGDKASTITVKSGETVHLCLNGHEIKGTYSFTNLIYVESGAELNLYDCQGGGRVSIDKNGNTAVSASGGTVNLYGGTIQGKEGTGISLTDGAFLLVDGGEIQQILTAYPISQSSAVRIETDSSARILSGRVAGQADESYGNNAVVTVKQNGKLYIDGGTVEGNWGEAPAVIAISNEANEEACMEINGGTIRTSIVIWAGTLAVNGVEIGGRIDIRSGVLKLKDGLPIGELTPSLSDIGISRSGMIDFQNAPARADGYTVQLLETAASILPKILTKNFSTYMPGKQPEDCFTYLSSGAEKDYYKMILSEGEVVLLPYVMTFDVNGGTPLEDSTSSSCYIKDGKGDITGGLYMRNLPTPVREGYSCDGWYTQKSGGEKIDLANNRPHEDMTVYAHWTPVEYDITYDLAGGSLPAGKTNPETYTIESADFTLVNPVRTGHTFTGWSGTGLTGSANKTVKVPKGSMEERTYTAHWKADAYKVTLNGNGGSGGTALTGYDYGAGATLPTDWEKTGYTFAGWYADVDCTGTAITEISATETGDKTFYAKWTANRYTVTFDHQGATGGSGTAAKEVAYDSTYGTLPSPTKSGYAFKGWYTQAGGKGTQVTSQTKMTTEGDHTLYAYWKDETKPAAPVLQSGTTLPSDWTKTQKTIPLTLSDGVGVTRLWVSVDGSAYQEVTGFANSNSDATVDHTFTGVTEGTHTYRFQAEDAAGNKSAESALFTVKLDTVKPVIGALSYTNKAATLWQWIIGKTSLVITVPVTDTGSGVTRISYTMTPTDEAGNESGQAETKTASVKNGTAQIAFAEAFRGKILISCTDAAGNAADDVTVDAKEGAKGVIVEDRAPAITVLADRGTTDMTETAPNGTALSESYYDSAPVMIVTVKDDGENAISAGVRSVTYQVGDAAQKSVTVGTGALQTEVTFRIPASEIPTGSSVVQIIATDYAGNQSTKNFTIKARGPERKPAAVIGFRTEKLTGLMPNGAYLINGAVRTADGSGGIPIEKSWLAATVSVVKKGNGTETTDSEAQSLAIPARPAAPSPTGVDEIGPDTGAKLTGLSANTAYDISSDGGKTWTSKMSDGSGVIANLSTPAGYRVRRSATDNSFVGEASGVVNVDSYKLTVTFRANGGVYRTAVVYYGKNLAGVPAVPPKSDAGDQVFAGEWCMDEAGTRPADFTAIKADMTVYACYSKGYLVTLQSGTGYTLTAASGSVSPVKEGADFTFRFALSSGYEKTAAFAVKVNGAAVALTAGETYTITDIMENKTVVVEGVQKQPSSDGTGGSGHKPGDRDKTSGGSDGADSDPAMGGTDQDSSGAGGGTAAADLSTGVAERKPVGTEGTAAGGDPFMGGVDQASVGTNRNAVGGVDGNVLAGRSIPVSFENGRLVFAGETIPDASGEMSGALSDASGKLPDTVWKEAATGNIDGMAAATTVLQMKDADGNPTGAVIVTVVCEEQPCTAGVADAVAVANTVLTTEQMQRVNDGETIEIRIDVTDISANVPAEDREVIEGGVEACRGELPGLTLGMYVDISMFIKVGDSDWNMLSESREPVEVVIGVPDALQSDGRVYYVFRAHEGEYTLMEDQDDAADTITIGTDRFSSYAIAYQEDGADTENGAGKCRLCHICPTFLGICCFIWLAVITAVIIIAAVVWRRKKQKETAGENSENA